MSDSTKKSAQQRAKLRVCASCEWVFHIEDASVNGGCPKCEFAHYGARFVYGDKAYRFVETQEPWMKQKLAIHSAKLHAEIREFNRKCKEGGFHGIRLS